ncbi:hypothetical protein [Telluria aromaticivorans]|uniref:Uncharacterized protein n=1 Tax=Telluria aromaticivorans TaxID=2725995 RepID=A0A7Y2JYJ4_9BURK|nr:hypothetical protein [Telluria aromaticivorans]NNG23385.1 hypothetical protein [Telluria aromaticivorans]
MDTRYPGCRQVEKRHSVNGGAGAANGEEFGGLPAAALEGGERRRRSQG